MDIEIVFVSRLGLWLAALLWRKDECLWRERARRSLRRVFGLGHVGWGRDESGEEFLLP